MYERNSVLVNKECINSGDLCLYRFVNSQAFRNRSTYSFFTGNCSIMVIALSGVQFGLKSDFRPKLHDTKCNFHFIAFILKSTSGNASLFTNTPELAPSCNIATCEQNGRHIKSGDTKQLDVIGDFDIKLMKTKRKNA